MRLKATAKKTQEELLKLVNNQDAIIYEGDQYYMYKGDIQNGVPHGIPHGVTI